MTAVSIRLKRGFVAAQQFVLGTAVAIGVQATVAIVFANFLMHNPSIIHNFKKVAVVVFLILAIFFLTKDSAIQVAEAQPVSKKRSFFGGVFMSFMNFLALPYLFAVGTWGLANHYLQPSWTYRFMFIAGAVGGSLLVNFGYVYCAVWVSKKASFLARNINSILGWFFLVLSIWQAWSIWG